MKACLETPPPAPALPASLSSHARLRMSQRGISVQALADVLRYGRCRHARGARFHFIGHRDVQRHVRIGLDLRHLENLQVLLTPDGLTVLTAYRNARLPRA